MLYAVLILYLVDRDSISLRMNDLLNEQLSIKPD